MRTSHEQGKLHIISILKQTMNYETLYEKLGHLFYAIASADKHVHPAEFERLKTLVSKEWLPLEDSTDAFGTDAAHYISIAFDYLQSEGVSSAEAFAVFSAYYEDNTSKFTQAIKKKILSTASAIADAFGTTNKKEKESLNTLKRLLK